MTMLKSLYDFSLMDLLPESLTRDPQIQACIKGLDEELRKLSTDIRETLLISRIDELSEDILDLLAWQFHLDFYQPTELNIETKRQLIRESIADHRIRGTPAAVEKLLTTVFKNAQVKEWWEFEGDPFQFRIEQLGRSLATEQDYLDFEKALDVAKNVRSHLESFTVRLTKILEMFQAFVNFQSKIKNKLYRLDSRPSQMNSMLGFIDIKSLYRIDKPRVGVYIPPMQEYIGFIKQKRLNRMYFPRNSDKFINDLRGTSILDLLILGLGILRESDQPFKPIWAFSDHSMREYIGAIQTRDIRKIPSHNFRIHRDLNSTFGIIRSKEIRKMNKPSLKFHQFLKLHCYLFAAKFVTRFFGAKSELPISAAIVKNLTLKNFIGFANLKHLERQKSPIIDLNSEIRSFIGAINLRSISKRKLLDTIEKEPIIYHHGEKLDLFAGFARILTGEIHQRHIPRTFFNINLNISAVNLKSIEKSKRHQINSIRTKSRVFIGAMFSRFVWRKFKPSRHESFYRKKIELPIYSGFARFNHIRREIRNSNTDHSSILKFNVANILLKSLIRKNLKHDGSMSDKTIRLNSEIKIFEGFTRISHRDKFKRDISNRKLELQNSIALINLRAVSKHAISKDSPTIHDESLNKSEFLNLYIGSINIRAISHKHLQFLKNPPSIQLNIAAVQFRSTNKKHPTLPLNSMMKLNEFIGCFSSKLILKRKISDYRLRLIQSPIPNLNMFADFVKIKSLNRKKYLPRSHVKNSNINAGIVTIKILHRENHAVSA